MPFLWHSQSSFCRWIQMAKRILSSKNQGGQHTGGQPPSAHQQQKQPPNQPQSQQPPQPQSNWRTMYQSRTTSRIAPAASMASSRSEVNLPRLPDGTNHPSLDHFGGNNSNGGNHLTMLKTKVWYHSQRNVQEASV